MALLSVVMAAVVMGTNVALTTVAVAPANTVARMAAVALMGPRAVEIIAAPEVVSKGVARISKKTTNKNDMRH